MAATFSSGSGDLSSEPSDGWLATSIPDGPKKDYNEGLSYGASVPYSRIKPFKGAIDNSSDGMTGFATTSVNPSFVQVHFNMFTFKGLKEFQKVVSVFQARTGLSSMGRALYRTVVISPKVCSVKHSIYAKDHLQQFEEMGKYEVRASKANVIFVNINRAKVYMREPNMSVLVTLRVLSGSDLSTVVVRYSEAMNDYCSETLLVIYGREWPELAKEVKPLMTNSSVVAVQMDFLRQFWWLGNGQVLTVNGNAEVSVKIGENVLVEKRVAISVHLKRKKKKKNIDTLCYSCTFLLKDESTPATRRGVLEGLLDVTDNTNLTMDFPVSVQSATSAINSATLRISVSSKQPPLKGGRASIDVAESGDDLMLSIFGDKNFQKVPISIMENVVMSTNIFKMACRNYHSEHTIHIPFLLEVTTKDNTAQHITTIYITFHFNSKIPDIVKCFDEYVSVAIPGLVSMLLKNRAGQGLQVYESNVVMHNSKSEGKSYGAMEILCF
eukprot:GHVS01013558.1.p1 GENE.GHVS01013558.1~~GHVS01013558.1.p1  ORF type:complete len:496 (+),score=30.18 GHVS01013558.1:942-2429(+)